jgi:hypothetical protein
VLASGLELDERLRVHDRVVIPGEDVFETRERVIVRRVGIQGIEVFAKVLVHLFFPKNLARLDRHEPYGAA